MLRLDYQENGFCTGRLFLNEASRWLSHVLARPTVVSIMPAFAKDRQAVEDFIIDVYAKAYGARIGVHYPVLMSVRDEDGDILAALGFRYAAQEPLFLEQYLRQPVEQVLGVPRDHVTEIGNLASKGKGASLFLFAAISAYLTSRGQTHAVLTGTNFLEKRFRTLGLDPKRLCVADPALLLQKDEDWGSYYDTKPNVLGGRLDESYKRLQRVLGARYEESRPRLLPRLHYREDCT